MKTYFECVPCLMRQAIEAPLRFTEDPEIRERIVRRVAAAVSQMDMTRPPPEMGGSVNAVMAEELGIADPYLDEKRRFNELAMELLPTLRRRLGESDRPFETALRFAIAGNVIDFGAPGGDVSGELERRFDEALEAPLFCPDGIVDRLRRRIDAASRILYLADNAGEVVVDRLLVEMMPEGAVTVAVRSGPAINDALLEDARYAGLDEVATLVESGAALPGTPMGRTSDEFRALFAGADLIISKGQGNFETLSDEDGPMVFLLMAKCPVVARHLGCEVGQHVIAPGPGFR